MDMNYTKGNYDGEEGKFLLKILTKNGKGVVSKILLLFEKMVL